MSRFFWLRGASYKKPSHEPPAGEEEVKKMACPKNFPNTHQPTVSKEKMSSQIASLEELRLMPKTTKLDIEGVKDRIQFFFNFCIDKSLRPGVELLCSALGITRTTLWEWEHSGGEIGQVVKQAKQLISALLEQWELEGEINPTTAIWLQKNHFGYQDIVTVQAEAKNGLDALPSKDDIAARLPVDDDIIDGEILSDDLEPADVASRESPEADGGRSTE